MTDCASHDEKAVTTTGCTPVGKCQMFFIHCQHNRLGEDVEFSILLCRGKNVGVNRCMPSIQPVLWGHWVNLVMVETIEDCLIIFATAYMRSHITIGKAQTDLMRWIRLPVVLHDPCNVVSVFWISAGSPTPRTEPVLMRQECSEICGTNKIQLVEWHIFSRHFF